MNAIYLDHAATSPLHPEVLNAMLPYLGEHYGNPSSIHSFGRAARTALDRARDGMAEMLGCKPGELIFTSGGTESNNTAIFCALEAARAPASGKPKHIVTTQIEHHAVLHPCERLARLGCDVTYIAPDERGQVDPAAIAAAIRPETSLISVMYVNNEVGSVLPIQAIGELAQASRIPFHVDAVQALGKQPLRLGELPAQLVSFSAHKIYGPKGIGVLYVRSGTALPPYLLGGNQERKRRAGTENVAGIVGFAKATELFAQRVAEQNERIERLRSRFLRILEEERGLGAFAVNGDPVRRVPHILNVSLLDTDTETALMNLDLAGIAASSGSACASGSLEVSHVLRAMRLPDEVTRSAIRFSFGLGNTMEQVEAAASFFATIGRFVRKGR